MIIRAIRTRIFRERENLADFIYSCIKKLPEKTIVVVTSKIVALSEGRVRVVKDERTRERLIKSESQWAVKTKHTWLTLKDGAVMSSAGVDESNANGKIILLPRDSFASASRLRSALQKRYKVKNVGVLITDSRLLPFRAGAVGIALGYAGFAGIRDYRGAPDIFGRKFKVTRADVADGIATAAVLVMGEGAEQRPFAVITKAPVEWRGHVSKNELAIDFSEDIYRPLLRRVRRNA